MRPIVVIILSVILFPLVIFLGWMNFETINEPLAFDAAKASRENVAIQRLKDIRTLQEAHKNVKGYYASTMDSLKLFYNTGSMKVVLQVGSKDDSLALANTVKLEKQLKAKGVKAKDMANHLKAEYDKQNGNLKLVFAVEHEVPVRDTLFNTRKDFCVDSLSYIPFTQGRDTIIMRSDIREVSGVKVPLFEAMIPYAPLLKGLDEQLVINLIAEKHDLELYPGLKVGDIEKPNNNAGNWE